MCGIAGFVARRSDGDAPERLQAALVAMAHRGPDDEGLTFINPHDRRRVELCTPSTMTGSRLVHRQVSTDSAGFPIGLGHRRFALVDPGPQSHQPFWSPDGKLCLSWNGEIYNHVELRGELAARSHRFETDSDTELFVEAYRAWGTACFERFIGFWAAALFDAERDAVLLTRDRIGKAPLYIRISDQGCYWASELKALRILDPGRPWTVREQSVVDFLYWSLRDLDGSTFFDEVTTFPAASFGWIGDDGVDTRRYWWLQDRRLSTTEISADEAAAELRSTLADAVRLRLRADVPIGVQVSGGLDSSSILALAAQHTDRISAYTVTFPQPEANEEPFARAVAEKYRRGVDYHVLSPPAEDHLTRLLSFVELMGEPFHSPNQITNHAIWESIRGHGLRGVLYGAGGDEIFAGYPNEYVFPYLRWLLRRGRVTEALRELVAFPATHHPNPVKNLILRGLFAVSPGYENRVRGNPVPAEIDPCTIPRADRRPTPAPTTLEALLKANVTRRLIPYWTHIDNQNSMGVPIELRSPFLDHRVVELGFRLPVEYLIHRGWTKWNLRLAMQRDLPDAVTWRRRKMGFPFPLALWLTAGRARLLESIDATPCPYIDHELLRSSYDRLVNASPGHLWRLLSVGLWWQGRG